MAMEVAMVLAMAQATELVMAMALAVIMGQEVAIQAVYMEVVMGQEITALVTEVVIMGQEVAILVAVMGAAMDLEWPTMVRGQVGATLVAMVQELVTEMVMEGVVMLAATEEASQLPTSSKLRTTRPPTQTPSHSMWALAE